VDAVELALRSASRPGAAGPEPVSGFPRSAVAVQLRSTLPPGQAGRVTGRLPGIVRPSTSQPDVDVMAVSGYEPGDRLDGWYDALLATVSVGARDGATAARVAEEVLSGLPETGVPHDGEDVCAVLGRLSGSSLSR
jgi:hypothetical protein